ncbi:MAG: carboxyl transferase domain-containing protein, partial [Eggerthellaceae bacterium]|nr:carboxyl transferase domain-containing protein [Eggerthellaceae bacterium]
VTVIAQEKGADLKDRIARNFGCPQPEGYRKSLRLMRQAEKFNRPIVCLVDTQGAFCGKEAEERGVGNAIADNLVAMAGLKVPIISAVLGEGGSGGALALAVSNKVAMQEHAVYSVLSPEGFASILWKDRSRAAEAAAVMKMSAQEAKELGLIEAVLLEGDGPAHENPEQAAAMVGAYIISSLEEFQDMSGEELRDQRYARFRKF